MRVCAFHSPLCLLPCSQEAVTKEFGPLQEFLEETREAGHAALVNLHNSMASSGKKLLSYHLRPLRGLLTPTARRAIIPHLTVHGVGPHHLAAACNAAVKDMWVEWTWHADNPWIHPQIRMPLSVCAMRTVYTTSGVRNGSVSGIHLRSIHSECAIAQISPTRVYPLFPFRFCGRSPLFAVSNRAEKERFRSSVETSWLAGTRMGRWRYSEEEPRPPMDAMLRAPFWTESAYEDLKRSFKEVKQAPQAEIASTGDIGEVRVGEGGPGPSKLVRVYRSKDAIPQEANDASILLIVVEVSAETQSGFSTVFSPPPTDGFRGVR